MHQGIDEKRLWLINSKKAALRLLNKADEISDRIFKSGNLRVFFSLLSRFSYLDYRNLLLLSAQYPQATDLAGASVWKSMAPKGGLFLKEEYQGKGISLLAPFTEISKTDLKLIWFTIKMYDISQTNIINGTHSRTVYLHNKKEHIDILIKSIRAFVAEEYNVSFLITKTEEHIKTGLPCIVKNKVIYIQPKSDELAQLSFFVEYIVKREIDEPLSREMILYLAASVRDCLFEIWDLPKQVSCSPPYESITDLSAEEQKTFLSKAQLLVRSIEDSILNKYRLLAKDRDIIYDDIL